MLSIPDLAIVGVFALLVFGPDKLPGVMRKAGHVMRDIQNTSQGFIREMERAADVSEPHKPWAPPEHPEDPAYPMHGYGSSSNGDALHQPTAEELDAVVPHAGEMTAGSEHPMLGPHAGGVDHEAVASEAERVRRATVEVEHAPAIVQPDRAPAVMQHDLAQTAEAVSETTSHPGKAPPQSDHASNI